VEKKTLKGGGAGGPNGAFVWGGQGGVFFFPFRAERFKVLSSRGVLGANNTHKKTKPGYTNFFKGAPHRLAPF